MQWLCPEVGLGSNGDEEALTAAQPGTLEIKPPAGW